MNKQPSVPYRVIRTIIYVTLVYTRLLGGHFYQSMDRLVKEVEYAAEMDRRANVIKRRD